MLSLLKFVHMLKGRAHRFPIGTERMHGGVRKVKTARGWVPVEREKRGRARLGAMEVNQETVRRVALDTGKKIHERQKTDHKDQVHTYVTIKPVDGSEPFRIPVITSVDKNRTAVGGIAFPKGDRRIVVYIPPKVAKYTPYQIAGEIEDTVAHEMAHMMDPQVHRYVPLKRKTHGRGYKNYADYYNSPAEMTARLVEIKQDMMRERVIQRLVHGLNTGTLDDSDPITGREGHLGNPVYLLGRFSKEWQDHNHHMTPENRKKAIKLAAEVIEAVRDGKLASVRYGRYTGNVKPTSILGRLKQKKMLEKRKQREIDRRSAQVPEKYKKMVAEAIKKRDAKIAAEKKAAEKPAAKKKATKKTATKKKVAKKTTTKKKAAKKTTAKKKVTKKTAAKKGLTDKQKRGITYMRSTLRRLKKKHAEGKEVTKKDFQMVKRGASIFGLKALELPVDLRKIYNLDFRKPVDVKKFLK